MKSLRRTLQIIVAVLLFLPANGFADEDLQKGICYATWQQDTYESTSSDESLKEVADTGATHVSIVVTRYQDSYDSTSIKQQEITPSDRSIKHAIRKAHKLGLKVMLKPHVDILKTGPEVSGFSRADIGVQSAEDWAKWFRGYKYFLLHYAKLGEELGVDLFCVGTELSFTSKKTEEWKALIAKVREVFSGELVYAANWDNYQNIHFWEDLDYVGIDAYFPLSKRNDPSVTQLVRGWEKWKQEILTFYYKNKKPILFTEIGYASTPTAAEFPWQGGETGNPDLDIQKKCYEAFFKTIWGCSWMKGAYFWRWAPSPNAGGENNRQFTPQNKPALEVLKSNYQK